MRKSSFLPMAVITIAAAVFALAAADAQSRKKFGRTSASKKELDTRYQKLQEELPSLQSAAVSEDEKMREEAKRRAFSVVDKALNKELDEEVAKEKARTSAADSVDSASESIRSSERSLEGAQEILPKADARRFAAMPDDAQLVSAFSGQDPADSTSGKDDGGTDFDGLKAVTADGETFTVPGIDVAEKFDGSAVPVQGNGPAPGPKPQPFVDKKEGEERT